MGDVMSDPLARATRALRDKYDATARDEGDPATRDRVIERAVRDGRERRIGRLVLLPIAATFVLFATWAAATGRLPTFLGGKAPNEPTLPVATAATTAATTAPSPRASALVADEREPAPAATEITAPRASVAIVHERAAPSASGARVPSAPSVAAAASHEPHVPSPEDELYAAAHSAHFGERDFGRALAAWDAYLAKAPAGRFAPEARYNRALCLARLGRTVEAKAALAPFASGAMGGYRRDEASKLLERLGDGN